MWNNCASSIEEDMDILDVDEELKDDSLFAREDKTHDDVCNILQQWKMNMQPTQQQEQDYKLNSKTFTRPKKRSLNFMGVQHSNDTQYGIEQMQNPNQNIALNMQNNNDPMYRSENSGPINLQIGGYVTNMHKSFLSDTSPPPSMDISLINNSLITSADFSNISFLQSTHENINLDTEKDILSNDCDYSFNDLLRDRKALDSLTLSADGTLIKDSNIAQIDDISLALSKTTSSCSTMDNSTNSVESSNVYFVEGLNKTYDGTSAIHDSSEGLNTTTILVAENSKPFKLEKTIILSSDMIADTTFNLESISIIENDKNDLNVTRPISNSLSSNDGGNKENEKISNITRNIASNGSSNGALNNQTFEANENFKKPLIDETHNLLQNATFEMQNKNTPDQKRCETPENKLINICISTPQTQNVYNKKQQFSSSLHKKDEVNISPIIGNNRQMNETYDYMYHKNNKNSETFSGSPPQTSIDLDNLITENLQHNHTFNKNYNELNLNQENLVETEMGNLQDLANVEAKLLAAHDDGIQFDYMLEELSKVHMTDDHNKVKKSIESIKKRLNCVAANSSSNSIKNDHDLFNNDSKDHEKSGFNLNRSLNDVKNDSLNSKENSSLSRSADRLLSRRSRLYDNINISSIQDNRKNTTSDIMNATFGETNNASTVLAGSTISNSKSNSDLNNITQSLEETGKINESTTNGVSKDSLEETGKQNANTILEKDNTQDKEYRPVPSVAKRERDRDRFKTIKIVRDHDSNKSGGSLLQAYNVPCIDITVDTNNDIGNDNNGYTGNDSYVLDVKDQENDADFYTNKDNEYSNQDTINAASTTIHVPQFNNNESEYDANKVNTNYLTFKYPKDKQNKRQLGLKSIPTIDTQTVIKPPATNTNTHNIIAPSSRSSGLQAPRSSSRPRYLSGLQKFSAVSKATSAGDLDISSSNASSNESLNARKSKINGAGLPLNKTSITGAAAATTSNLKSPMGIKSKSFHNLSNQVSTGIGICSNQTKNMQSKLQRPGNKLNATTNCSEPIQNQKPDDSAFKVPKSFMRPSTASGIKRPGLPRPASGYYSLNNIPGKGGFTKVEIADNDDESSIPTETTPSEPTRGNLLVAGHTNKVNSESTDPKSAKPSIMPSSGIPKPSGIRPPSSVKRSGLPRPLSSIIKH